MNRHYIQKIGKTYYDCWYERISPYKTPKKYILHKKALKGASRDLALQIINKLNEDNLRQEYGLAPSQKLFSQFLDDHKKYKISTKAPRTQERDLQVIQNFLNLTKITYVSEFNVKTIDKYVALRRQQKPGIKNSSINRELNCLCSCGRSMVKYKYTTVNPLQYLERLKAEDVMPVFFTNEELQKIFTAFKGDWLTLAMLGYYLGLRLNEAAPATIDNIMFDTNNFVLVAPKTKKMRVIPMHSHLIKYFLDLKKQGYYNTDNRLVRLPYQTMSALSKAFRKKLEAIGIKNKPYKTFRHTFATKLREKEVNQENIKEFLGHSTLAMTQIYSHLSTNKQLETAINKLDIFGR